MEFEEIRKKIEFPVIRQQHASVYFDDQLIGTLFNSLELNHLRIQIVELNIEGIYIVDSKGEKYPIKPNGDCTFNFDKIFLQQFALMIRAKKKEENYSSFKEKYLENLKEYIDAS